MPVISNVTVECLVPSAGVHRIFVDLLRGIANVINTRFNLGLEINENGFVETKALAEILGTEDDGKIRTQALKVDKAVLGDLRKFTTEAVNDDFGLRNRGDDDVYFTVKCADEKQRYPEKAPTYKPLNANQSLVVDTVFEFSGGGPVEVRILEKDAPGNPDDCLGVVTVPGDELAAYTFVLTSREESSIYVLSFDVART